MSSPATDGPTIRVALIAAAPSATALTTRWRSTRSATSAWRVGRSAASVAPKTIATTRIAAKLAWLVATSRASEPALRPSRDWVTSRILRLGRRSARAPPASDRITEGTPSAAATQAPPPPRETVAEDTAGRRQDHRGNPVGRCHPRDGRRAPGALVDEIAERDNLHPGAEQGRPLGGPIPAEWAHPQRGRRPSALSSPRRPRRRVHLPATSARSSVTSGLST